MDAGAEPFVQTVLGRIDPGDLGPTLTHEHLVVDWDGARGLAATPVESRAAVTRVLGCVGRAAAAGVKTLVDVGTELYGPTPLMLQLAALNTPVSIVCSTGLFEADLLPVPGWACSPAGPEDIAARFVRAATEGVGGSGVKPGIIKIGTSPRAISEIEENMLRAAALAQQRTGLAITTHTRDMARGIEQVGILEDAGADLDRVVIGHIGWYSGPEDFELFQSIAQRGVRLGLDTVGLPNHSLDEWARMTMDLIEAGFADRILFSHDTTAYERGVEGIWEPECFAGDFTVVHRGLLPLLRERGVTEAILDQMSIGNPRRVLTVDPGRYPGARETLLAEGKDPCLEWLGDLAR